VSRFLSYAESRLKKKKDIKVEGGGGMVPARGEA
jgi:hypothetical protein